MAINRKWVLYNTLTGAIIKELPASEDSVYIDINSGDEATLTIPAYSLSATDRPIWTSVFKSWARGIALIDNNKAYNASGAVIFAGPIVKRNYNGMDETITLTAYGIYEYLKKITVPPVWTEVTDAALTETFTADSWAGVYSAVLQRGIDPTGKPAGLNFMNTFTGLPTVTGTGYSYTVKVIDQVKVSDVFEDIRDNVSTNGNEFRFVPTFTDATMATLTWNLLVGTDAAPKINYTDLTVPLYEEATPTKIWRATEYTVDDDNTLIYNKLVINGSTDPVTANMETVYDATTDPEMPILTEVFEPGVTITQAQLDTQKAQRIIGSLIGDKNITLALSNDLNFDSFTYVGNKVTLDASGSDKMAGTGTKARAVGIRFTSASRENEVTIELMKIQARYPKLPNDQSSELLSGDAGYDFGDISFGGGTDFGNPAGGYGTGGSGFETGGDIYTPPPVEPGTPEVTNPYMLAGGLGTTSGTSDQVASPIVSNLTAEGFQYIIQDYSDASLFPIYYYNNGTDVISDIPIKVRKITINETLNQEVRFNTEYVTASSYTVSGTTLTTALASPATITYISSYSPTVQTGTTGPKTNQSDTDGQFSMNLWTIKNKLYFLITKGRMYGNNAMFIGRRYTQKLFSLDINTSTGALSNLTELSGKWGPTAITSNANIFLGPDSWSQNSVGEYNPEKFKIDNNNMLFMKVKKYYNYTMAGPQYNQYLDLTKWTSTEIGYRAIPIKPVKADFTATGAPLYTETAIVPPTPVPDTAATSTVYNGGTTLITGYIDTIGEYHATPYTGGNKNQAYYVYHPTQNKIYCTLSNNFNQAVYTTPIATLETQTRYKVFECDLSIGSTSFSQVGGSYESFLSTSIKTGIGNSNPLMAIPLNDNLYLQVQTDGLATTPTSAKTLTLKNGSWVLARRGSISNTTSADTIYGSKNLSPGFFKTLAGKDIILTNVGTSYAYSFSIALQEELSPYKVKCKYATKYLALDTTNKLWVFGVYGVTPNIWGSTAPVWSETTIPMKHPNNTSWKQIVTNVSYQASYLVTLAIASDNTLWAWGSNQNYLTGQATNTGVTAIPTQVGTKTWSKVVVGSTVVAALDTDGALYTWGTGTTSGLGQGTNGTSVLPTRVGTKTYIDLDMASTGLMLIDSNRDLFFTGTITGQTANNTPTILGSQKWKKIVVSDSHYMGITTADTLFALGSNANGRTGLNTVTGTATTWTQVGTDTWTDIAITKNGATTYGASFGIKTGGTLWEWGYAGLTGITGTGNTLLPNQAGTDTDWTAVFPDGYCVRSNGVAYSPTTLGTETWVGTIASDWRTIFGGETG